MNKQPIIYMQTDPRWSKLPYQVPGETATIGGSGCGPSCAAMLIETLTGQTFTPEDACKWSVEHGHKALKQGTYYSYFVPQFKAFGINCQQLNGVSLYGTPASSAHTKAFDLLKQGYYLIACMGKGLWTSSGHFVVVWWEDGKVRINDPASTKEARLNGDIQTFRSQVKYYWAIDARDHNKEDDDVTQEQFNKMFNTAMAEYRAGLQTNEGVDANASYVQFVRDNGIMVGGGPDKDGNPNFMWRDFTTRAQLAIVLERAAGVIESSVLTKVKQLLGLQ